MSEWMEIWESPYESVESVPIKVTWDEWFDQTLSKWSESMRFDWIEVNRVKWVNGWIWLEWTLWESPYGRVKVNPIEVTWMKVKINVPIKMNEIDEKWMNWVKWGEMSEWMEMTWNNPMAKSLWSEEGVPMRVTWVNSVGISLWVENECPYQNDLNDLNEKVPMFSWMNVPIKMTWNNPMGITLWVENECPYQNDLNDLNEKVPIKMNGIDEIWMKWSE